MSESDKLYKVSMPNTFPGGNRKLLRSTSGRVHICFYGRNYTEGRMFAHWWTLCRYPTPDEWDEVNPADITIKEVCRECERERLALIERFQYALRPVTEYTPTCSIPGCNNWAYDLYIGKSGFSFPHCGYHNPLSESSAGLKAKRFVERRERNGT